MYVFNNRPTFPSTKRSRISYFVRFSLMAIYILCIQQAYLWQLHGMMEWSYYKYLLHKDNYLSVSAKVIDQEEYYIEFKPDHGSYHGIKTFKANKLNIEYEIEGRKYSIWTKLYPDYKLGDVIQIAVDKTDYQVIQRISSYSIFNIPLIVVFIISMIWILLFIILFKVLHLYKMEDEGLLDPYNRKIKYSGNQIPDEKTIISEQQICIDIFVKEKALKKDVQYINLIKNNLLLNDASEWYVYKGVSMGDVILLREENGKSACLKETEYLKQYGLPEDYYVMAVKESCWLCCCAKEECIYAFSKTHGLTRTEYQSLYDYIIKTCNIPFMQKNMVN